MITTDFQTIPVNGQFTVDGNNVIKTSQSDIENGYVQFTLQVSADITWWKGVKVFNGRGDMVSLLATQDDARGPVSSPKFPKSDFGNQIELEIWKAKALGVHVCVATVYVNMDACSGKNTELYWVNDH